MLKRKDVKLHILMCLIGGFAGTYSLLRCHDNFGSAQTANLIVTLKLLLGGDLKQFIFRVMSILSYFAGFFSSVVVSHRTNWNLEHWILIVEAACLLVVGLMPLNVNFFLCLYPIFFMTAAQWSVFHGTQEYNASTIFSSNNFKQLTLALGEYYYSKNAAAARKAKFFGMTLTCYHIGVVAALLSYRILDHYSIFICYLPLLTAAAIMYQSEHVRQKAVISAVQ